LLTREFTVLRDLVLIGALTLVFTAMLVSFGHG
jgi:hypothetical protein